jgi:hypothetical protein
VIHIDLATAAGRAQADQYLAQGNTVLDGIIAAVAHTLNISRANDYDRAAIVIELIAASQANPRDDIAQLFPLAVHRLAVAELDGPESGTFNARMLPSRECEMRITLPPGDIDLGKPPWEHLRVMAAELLKQADEMQLDHRNRHQ